VNGNQGSVFLGTWFAQLAFPGRLAPAFRVGLERSESARVSSRLGAASVQWSEITFAPCIDLFRSSALRLGPCLNVELKFVEASVIAPLPARTFSYLWLTGGASAKLSWRLLPPLSVDLMAGARASLSRSELFFEQDRSTPVYRAPLVIPFAGLSFVLHLP